jgi:hypothetical protein
MKGPRTVKRKRKEEKRERRKVRLISVKRVWMVMGNTWLLHYHYPPSSSFKHINIRLDVPPTTRRTEQAVHLPHPSMRGRSSRSQDQQKEDDPVLGCLLLHPPAALLWFRIACFSFLFRSGETWICKSPPPLPSLLSHSPVAVRKVREERRGATKTSTRHEARRGAVLVPAPC